MGVIQRVREAITPGAASVDAGEVAGLRSTVEILEANLTQLEQALLEPGWLRMAATSEMEFTREGLQQIARLCRLMRIKNPLLRRASAIKVYYVFGQGVQVSAEDEQVAEVVSEFVDDTRNQKIMFGTEAQEENERTLHTDANLFIACFTHPRTGRIQLRDLPLEEINDVIYNPQDRAEVWFYERHWTEVVIDPVNGHTTSQLRKALYPDVDYRPRPGRRLPTWAGLPVRWDSPVLHVVVNKPTKHWRFGVPELYPALDWARAHAEYLDDFRKLVKVLAKLAWRLQGVKGSQIERARAKIAQATAEDAPTGQAWVADPGGGQLEPAVKTGGVNVEPGDARQFALMVSASTDVPETMLLGDPSTGNLATATTLDRPTELAFEHRRRLWNEAFTRLCQYAIDASVKAPAGKLRGVIERDEWDQEVITLRGDAPRTINVDWPPIVERSMGDVIKALVGTASGANAIENMPWQVILRTALVALDVDDPDEIVTEAEQSVEREPDQRTEQDQAVADALAELREAIASLPDAA